MQDFAPSHLLISTGIDDRNGLPFAHFRLCWQCSQWNHYH